MQKLLEIQDFYIINADDFPDFEKQKFDNDIDGDVLERYLKMEKLIHIANSLKIPLSEVNRIIKFNTTRLGIILEEYTAIKIGGYWNGGFEKGKVDVYSEYGEIISVKFCNTARSVISYSQSKDLGNEYKKALKQNTNYYLAVMNIAWGLFIIIKEVNPNGEDSVKISQNEQKKALISQNLNLQA